MPDSCCHCIGPVIVTSCDLFQEPPSRIGHQGCTRTFLVPANFAIANNWNFGVTDRFVRLGQHLAFPLIDFSLQFGIYAIFEMVSFNGSMNGKLFDRTLRHTRVQKDGICGRIFHNSSFVVNIHFYFPQVFSIPRCLNEKSLHILAVIHVGVRSHNLLV